MKTHISRQQKLRERFSVHPFSFPSIFFLFSPYGEWVHKHSEPSDTYVFYLYCWIQPAVVHSYSFGIPTRDRSVVCLVWAIAQSSRIK